MKEKNGNNSIRSFEMYEKMMKENKSKSRMIDNNENDILTVKDNIEENKLQRSNTSRGNLSKDTTTKYKKSMESQYSGNKKINKSSQKQQKPLSPNRHKNHNHSPMRTVPYSQIQLILQSIQSIKSKAKQQILQLTTKNNHLSLQNEKLRRQITRLKQSQSNLVQQIKTYNKHQQSLQDQYKRKQSDILVKSRIWNQQKQQYIQEMLNVKEMNRLNEEEVRQLKERLEIEVRNGEQWKEKYEELVDKLTAGRNERLAEVVYQLQTKYYQSSIMDTLQQLQLQKLMLQKQCQKHKNQTIISQQRLMSQKQQRIKLQHMLSNMIEENRGLIETITVKENNFKQQRQALRQQLMQTRDSNSQTTRKLQNQLTKLHSQNQSQQQSNLQTITHFQQLNAENQHMIEQLKCVVFQLQQNVQMKQIQIKQLCQQKRKLQLDEQCEELQDLEKIIHKLQIIQKIKLENQTNIQKIQFLTKMLDC